ncbi:Hypothetical predicted protein [Prunus dulcis]|uniref:Uncharacterized protein n=1 Tax=Prunus dulcis TaxID=3755 RepID=A0A5E4GI26_PRUDU|nr:Hypothetical predicted protein [Prunus dulcis]
MHAFRTTNQSASKPDQPFLKDELFEVAFLAAKCGRQRLQFPEMETRSGHGRGGGESTNHSLMHKSIFSLKGG